MSFSTIETSNEQGVPVRLYEFRCGNGKWNFASRATDVSLTIGNEVITYKAAGFSDSGINQSGELTSDVFTIEMPADSAPAKCFIGTPPAGPMTVTLRDYHPGADGAPLVQVVVVDQMDWPQPGTARASCQTRDASMEREGLRLGYQRSCPYALYDEHTCKVDRENFKFTGLIRTVSNGVLDVPGMDAHENGRFSGGYIEWEHPLLGPQQRGIEEHIGNQLRLFGPSDGLYPGLPVSCFYGCSNTPAACKQIFNNYDNYGGFPTMPGESPFNRSSSMF